MTDGIQKVLVTGATGYVGNYLLKSIARQYPSVQCIGLSRRGTVRKGETKTQTYDNVSFVAGDCLKPSTFQQTVADVDAVVHTVGILFEGSGTTYEAYNRDTVLNVAYELNQAARQQ